MHRVGVGITVKKDKPARFDVKANFFEMLKESENDNGYLHRDDLLRACKKKGIPNPTGTVNHILKHAANGKDEISLKDFEIFCNR